MSAAASGFGPYAFELTDEEAGAAASRAPLRAALDGGLLSRHFAPLAAFALAMLFAAILAFTGLVSRRSADFALILAAAAFMANRLWSRRRFARARRAALDWTQRLKSAGELVVSVDDRGLSLVAGALRNVWTFADAQDVEDAGGLVYLWPRRGEPAVLPSRVFPDAAAIARFVSFARAHGAKGSQPSPVDDDD